ncbi:MAG: hypothetical protein IJF33_04735, partial [Clostridia bacterium]|nr:hypothetical protein [Clostridia bacterium]
MEAYRRFLKKTVAVCLPALLILSALAGVISHPAASLFGMPAFTREGEAVTMGTLSVMLAGFCLAALLLGLWDKDLSRPVGLLLAFCGVTALFVPLLRELLPFTLDGYVFPLITGLAVPRLLLALLPAKSISRFDMILAIVSGGMLLLLSAAGIYGVFAASD